jgi:peptidyl-prolyl isomerase E (cyclophilin E)
VTAETLRAAFVPFGEVTDVGLPMEQTTQKHRGFAFVQFESADDAQDAIDNMDGAELFGRVLKVNVSKPSATKGAGNRPVWEADADNFYQHGDKQEVAEEGVERWRNEKEPS